MSSSPSISTTNETSSVHGPASDSSSSNSREQQITHVNELSLVQGAEHPGLCSYSPQSIATRKSSVEGTTFGTNIRHIPDNVNNEKPPVPMTHPTAGIEMKVFYDENLLPNVVAHLTARATVNLFSARRLPAILRKNAIESLPENEQRVFFDKSRTFAGLMREFITDTHLPEEDRRVSKFPVHMSSQTAVKSAWLASLVPLTKTDSPSMKDFVSHAFSWLDKVTPANISDNGDNGELAAQVRLTLEHLSAALRREEAKQLPEFNAHTEKLMDQIKKYFDNRPRLDSAPCVEYKRLASIDLPADQRNRQIEGLRYLSKLAVSEKHRSPEVESKLFRACGSALAFSTIGRGDSQKTILSYMAAAVAGGGIDPHVRGMALDNLVYISGPQLRRAMLPENRELFRQVIDALFASEPELSPEEKGAILGNHILHIRDDNSVESWRWVLDRAVSLSQQSISPRQAQISLVNLGGMLSFHGRNASSLQAKALSVVERLLNCMGEFPTLIGKFSFIEQNLLQFRKLDIFDPALDPRMDAIIARLRNLAG